jgi:hypothetical protein
MIHRQVPPSKRVMNRRMEDHPLRISLTQSGRLLQPEIAKLTSSYEHPSRKIGIVFPLLRLAAPVQDDILSQVWSAYKRSAINDQKQAFQLEETTSARISRWQGLGERLPSPQSTGILYGSRLSLCAGRTEAPQRGYANR